MQITPVPMTPLETILMILSIAAGTALTRYLPFWLFPDNRKIPKVISALSHTLPPAMIGLLVVYCLKDLSLTAPPYALPEALAVTAIAALHLYKRNVLLSIAGGTAVYMVLLRLI